MELQEIIRIKKNIEDLYEKVKIKCNSLDSLSKELPTPIRSVIDAIEMSNQLILIDNADEICRQSNIIASFIDTWIEVYSLAKEMHIHRQQIALLANKDPFMKNIIMFL